MRIDNKTPDQTDQESSPLSHLKYLLGLFFFFFKILDFWVIMLLWGEINEFSVVHSDDVLIMSHDADDGNDDDDDDDDDDGGGGGGGGGGDGDGDSYRP